MPALESLLSSPLATFLCLPGGEQSKDYEGSPQDTQYPEYIVNG